MLDKIVYYMQFPFARYALIVGVLISLCSAVFGVTLVLKRFSFMGDGLSHAAFCITCVAGILNLTNKMVLVLPVTILFAVLLIGGESLIKMKGDASVAVLSVSSLALGYLLMNLFGSSTNLSGDVCGTLFGSTSILTLSTSDLVLCIVLSVVVLGLFIFFYNKIFAVTFDEKFAQATGVKAKAYSIALAVVIAIIIVLAMNLVGSLLITALIIFPALSSMRLFKSFKSVTISSAVISVVCAVSGILVSILAGTPVGSTIVAADLLVFVLCCILGGLKK